jgi:hypothetical protein
LKADDGIDRRDICFFCLRFSPIRARIGGRDDSVLLARPAIAVRVHLRPPLKDWNSPSEYPSNKYGKLETDGDAVMLFTFYQRLAPPGSDSEVVPRARRRTITSAEKRGILQAADRCTMPRGHRLAQQARGADGGEPGVHDRHAAQTSASGAVCL